MVSEQVHPYAKEPNSWFILFDRPDWCNCFPNADVIISSLFFFLLYPLLCHAWSVYLPWWLLLGRYLKGWLLIASLLIIPKLNMVSEQIQPYHQRTQLMLFPFCSTWLMHLHSLLSLCHCYHSIGLVIFYFQSQFVIFSVLFRTLLVL